MRRDFGGNPRHRTHRNAEHHQIGTDDGLGRGLIDAIHKTDLERGFPRFGRARMTDDLARETAFAHRMGHRRGDQPKPDQSDAVVMAHVAPPALNTPIICATRRHEGSSPTVMRRQFGRP